MSLCCYTSATVLNATLLLFLFIPCSHSVNFQISRFRADENLILRRGDAEVSVGEIELNNADYVCRVGQVIYNGKVPLWDSNSGKLTDFTTRFSFRIDTQNRKVYGNGIAFFLAPAGFQIPPNSAGSYLGLFNTSTTDTPQSQIVSVEFDSYINGWDPNYEHVGINKNSISSVVTTPWNASLHSGDSADTWIGYNATTRNLSVFWRYGNRPNSSLSYQIDLKEVLPQWVIVGFSAGTGAYGERNTLESWEFWSGLDIKEGNSAKKIWIIVGSVLGSVLLIAVAAGALVLLLKWRNKEATRRDNPEAANMTSLNVDLERGAGPRRFSYEDLALATNNFSDEKKLGQGGFGGVYKGHLIDLDIPIAVKKFFRGSEQGKKEFLAEVKVISLLRHRNLVRLIGWCHDEGAFLLVYEFMPNGSLDHHLFGRRNPLGWSLRYKIAQGLASALLYLHEEWEQCVVHRDIKSSNVMLDSNFNVKLGDFGLARLMDHELGPHTTVPAGTPGYMAPEYRTTWRASKESDVYSFGVLALEIATGRMPGSRWDELSQTCLEGWVWDLYGKGQLLSAVDERVKRDFEPKQMECLMIVGLWCAHPDPSLRPSIRQASRVLNFEAQLPQLPCEMPVATYGAPRNPLGSLGEPYITNTSIDIGR